jgi:hypothetical protein
MFIIDHMPGTRRSLMKKITYIVLTTCLLPAICLANSFFLKHDKTGTVYGPFEFKDGTTVELGKENFRLIKPTTKPMTLKQVLKATEIPKIEFRQTNVRDVIDFLQQASAEFCPSDDPKWEHGVNIVLNLQKSDEDKLPAITFTTEQISLMEALDVVTQIAGLEQEIRENTIMIRVKK